ncbi:DUF1707 and FHA domain-containing protein [Kribbella sp. CA-293567]|uniref:DUF1707 and FHA domain-containing protein n=1 Tax=Kribbella sp. CA-293567 TaxID=3002436 RepID=UPI0022DE52F7|nr:DUF1707 and FHA domain-containing protein [Kribbella sp. CA-293567]WBQ01827.1 DUF1707 and FHA domain-containing protein [Kribbella sp. CA-293567]
MTAERIELARPSDAERDRALAILRDGAGSGRLSHDTFIRRMNFVLRAQSRRELANATHDLPGTEPRAIQLLNRLLARVPRLTLALRPAATPVRPQGLALPPPGSPTVRIGRVPGATLRLADLSVSRFHAELRPTDNGWLLRDLGSMNGTHLNGLRITTPVQVRPGDHIRFGAVTYHLTWTDPS